MRVLLSWLGKDELPRDGGQSGPLTRAIGESGSAFEKIVLLNNLSPEEGSAYARSLPGSLSVVVVPAPLESPVDYRAIHAHAVRVVEEVRALSPGARLSFFLNSGTAPMGSVWLLLVRIPAIVITQIGAS